MATKRRKSRKSRKSCKNGKLKRPVRTKKGGKRRCKKSNRKSRKKGKSRRKYKMIPVPSAPPMPENESERPVPSAPPMPENESERNEVRNLMENLSKNPGLYEFVDMAGNSKFIDIFTPIKDEKASRREGETRWEPVYKRIERAFGSRVSIFRRCHPDISKLLPENIPNDKLIFKGQYNNDVWNYNKKHNITDHRQILRGLQIFPRVRETAQMYSMKDYDELSIFTPISFPLYTDIPEYIATHGYMNSRNHYEINDRIKGQNILNFMNLYEDTECLKNSDDLINLTEDFRRTATRLTEYRYDNQVIPLRDIVNGVPKYSPAFVPIDHFIIYYDEPLPPQKKKTSWFGY